MDFTKGPKSKIDHKSGTVVIEWDLGLVLDLWLFVKFTAGS